jgi:hypothetical protein
MNRAKADSWQGSSLEVDRPQRSRDTVVFRPSSFVVRPLALADGRWFNRGSRGDPGLAAPADLAHATARERRQLYIPNSNDYWSPLCLTQARVAPLDPAGGGHGPGGKAWPHH